MLLALLVEKLGDESETAEDVDNDEHNNIPPTGLFSVDGTKVLLTCAVSLHNKSDVLLYVRKINHWVVYKKEIFRAWSGST